MQQTCTRLVANPGAGAAGSWLAALDGGWRVAAGAPVFDGTIAGLDGRRYRVAASWAERAVTVCDAQNS